MFAFLKTLMPRGLYGRALLILILPIVIIQLVVSIAFIQRHYERVTRQMTQGVAIELRLLMERAATPQDLQSLAADLGFALRPAAEWRLNTLVADPWDLSGQAVAETLAASLADVPSLDLLITPDDVQVLLPTKAGPAIVTVDRKRVSATNPHQLLVVMIITSVLMTLIAYLFLRNQLRPIKRLARASEAFGKGRHMNYKPAGANEVRAAGAAFLDMRARIERQIEQRTLMLSGVSHDLRTPLTRLRLGLSLLDDVEAAELLNDVGDMERLVDEFLSFARGDAMEEPELVDVQAFMRRVVDNAQRAGQNVVLTQIEGPAEVRLRPDAVARAVENLVGNAVRYGKRAEVSVAVTDRAVRITIEDDGPGIAKDRREEALLPFTRLDGARDPNRGGGAGLGLSIAVDIARSHGGSLRLGESAALGGLKAELILAR